MGPKKGNIKGFFGMELTQVLRSLTQTRILIIGFISLLLWGVIFGSFGFILSFFIPLNNPTPLLALLLLSVSFASSAVSTWILAKVFKVKTKEDAAGILVASYLFWWLFIALTIVIAFAYPSPFGP